MNQSEKNETIIFMIFFLKIFRTQSRFRILNITPRKVSYRLEIGYQGSCTFYVPRKGEGGQGPGTYYFKFCFLLQAVLRLRSLHIRSRRDQK